MQNSPARGGGAQDGGSGGGGVAGGAEKRRGLEFVPEHNHALAEPSTTNKPRSQEASPKFSSLLAASCQRKCTPVEDAEGAADCPHVDAECRTDDSCKVCKPRNVHQFFKFDCLLAALKRRRRRSEVCGWNDFCGSWLVTLKATSACTNPLSSASVAC